MLNNKFWRNPKMVSNQDKISQQRAKEDTSYMNVGGKKEKVVHTGKQYTTTSSNQGESSGRTSGYTGVKTEDYSFEPYIPPTGSTTAPIYGPTNPNNGARDPNWTPPTEVPDSGVMPPPENTGGVQTPVTDPTETSETVDPREEVGKNYSDPKSQLEDKELEQTYTKLEISDEEMQDPTKNTVDPLDNVEAVKVDNPDKIKAEQVEAETVDYTDVEAKTAELTTAQAAEDVVAQQVTASLIDINSLTSAVEEIAKAEPMQAASMAKEMDGLLGELENGNVPLWARPAVAQVEQMLSSRGLSASSIGRDSLFNAIVQSAMPIAQQDATFKQDKYKTEYNARIQGIISDVNMEFAAKQFNASSKNQVAQFNAQLKAEVDSQNAARKDAMSQFNAQAANQMEQFNVNTENQMNQFNAANQLSADQFNAQANNQMNQFNAANNLTADQFNVQTQLQNEQFMASQINTINQFMTELEAQRQQFNATMVSQIEQSNVNWRRQVNQINTAGINAVNQGNVQNAFNLSNQALTFLWQELRDNAQWDFQASEADKDRKNQLEATLLSNETAMGGEFGEFIENMINGIGAFDSFLELLRG